MSYPIEPLLTAYAAHADPARAQAMSAYMRDLFPFYGIKKPERSVLLRAHLLEFGQPPVAELGDVVRELWHRPERECQYTAMELIQKQIKKVPVGTLDLIEQLIITKSWWDTVDALISYAGTLFQRFPDARINYLPRWRTADDIWLRRSAILFQRAYKKDTDVELLQTIIRENLGSDEFFINKAVGWALREYSKIDSQIVRDFVAKTDLAPLSEREALKWLKNKGKLS